MLCPSMCLVTWEVAFLTALPGRYTVGPLWGQAPGWRLLHCIRPLRAGATREGTATVLDRSSDPSKNHIFLEDKPMNADTFGMFWIIQHCWESAKNSDGTSLQVSLCFSGLQPLKLRSDPMPDICACLCATLSQHVPATSYVVFVNLPAIFWNCRFFFFWG